MRLIHDDVTIGEGVRAIRLRPSLRAAMRLNRDWGLKRLVEGVNCASISIISAIVAATAEDPDKAAYRLDRMIDRDGLFAVMVIRPQLGDILAACFGLDRDAPDDAHPAEREAEATGRPLSFDRFFERLFEVGTGWLEWSPAETYAATPAEILIAQRGKLELLRAIHGTADKEGAEEGSTFTKNPTPDMGDIPLEQVRQNLAELKALLGQ